MPKLGVGIGRKTDKSRQIRGNSEEKPPQETLTPVE